MPNEKINSQINGVPEHKVDVKDKVAYLKIGPVSLMIPIRHNNSGESYGLLPGFRSESGHRVRTFLVNEDNDITRLLEESLNNAIKAAQRQSEQQLKLPL